MSVLLSVANVASADDADTSADIIFRDSFHNKLAEGWSWIREHKENWRCTTNGLEVLVEPGNMWGPQNNARNLLLHSLPTATDAIDISVTVSNAPTHQYEQSDLVWYFDDSTMVKVGQELVDGKLSVVMGREEKDKIRTISITPLNSDTVTLRMLVHGDEIRGFFKTPTATDWKEVGSCDLPKPEKKKPARVSLQFYQGAPNVNHWVRVTDFQISRTTAKR
ncbi:MAG: hypothetical protein ACXWBP_03130 [Limisphaerales bacterium]